MWRLVSYRAVDHLVQPPVIHVPSSMTERVIAGISVFLLIFPAELQAQEKKIPTDVSYSVVNSDIVPGEKRGLEVRINKRVSKEVLRAIAQELKSRGSGKHERTFIDYYLPDMEIGAGAWATTHFEPDVNVRILGLTRKRKKELSSENGKGERQVLGRWLHEGFSGSRFVLFRKSGNLYLEQTFEDGGSRVMEVVEKESPHGCRIERIEDRMGDFWVINDEGNLERRDDKGVIWTAEAIE